MLRLSETVAVAAQETAAEQAHTTRGVVAARASDVDFLLAQLWPRRTPLSIGNLPVDEARQRAERIYALRNECGCGTGAAFAMSTIGLTAVWLIADPPSMLLSLAARLGAAALAVVIAGGVGKVTGIGRARRALRRELIELRARLPET